MDDADAQPPASAHSVFTLNGLYPCGAACSAADEPCSDCLTAPSDLLNPPDPPFLPRPLARQLPRSPLRTVYAQLLHSIREFVSDRLGSIAGSPDLLPIFRCQDGVILTGADGFSDWGAGWVHRSRNRLVSLPIHAFPDTNVLCDFTGDLYFATLKFTSLLFVSYYTQFCAWSTCFLYHGVLSSHPARR